MYCKHCGKELNKDALYCTSCGATLNTEIDVPKVEDEKENYCGECGAQIKGNYCINCGKAAYKYTVKEGSILKGLSSIEMPNIKGFNFNSLIQKFKETFKDMAFIKNVSVYTGIALGIAIVLSLLISVAFFGDINEGLLETKQGIEQMTPNAKFNFKASFLDAFGFSHLNKFKIRLEGIIGNRDKSTVDVNINICILLLLLVPILSFLGAMLIRKENKNLSTRDNIKLYLTSSILYSIVANILLLFNNKIIHISAKSFFDIDFSLKAGFAFFSGLISVFVVTFIIQILISMILKRDKLTDVFDGIIDSDILNSFSIILKNIIIYSLGLTVIFWLLGMFGVLGSDFKELFKKPAILLFLPNMIAYIYLFIFGNTLSITLGDMSITHGVIRTKVTGLLFGNPDSVYGLIFMNLIIIIGTAVLLYIAIKRLQRENFFINLSKFGLTISLFNAIIALYSRISIYFKGELGSLSDILYEFGGSIPINPKTQMHIGASVLKTFIVTFVFVLIVGLVRYYLEDRKELIAVENFVKKYKKQILIAAPIVIFIVSLISFKAVGKSESSMDTYSNHRGVTEERHLDTSEIDYIEPYDIIQIYFAGHNSYLIVTEGKVCLYDLKGRKTDILFEEGYIKYALPSDNLKKVAVVYEDGMNGNSVKVIDLKGKELLNNAINGFIRWSPDGNKILVEGDTHKIIDLKSKESEKLGVPGYNLLWKDNKTIFYLQDKNVYQYNIDSKESKSLDKTAEKLLKIRDKVYLITQSVNEEGEVVSQSIQDLEGKTKLEFKGYIYYFNFINNEEICAVYGSSIEENEYSNPQTYIFKKVDENYQEQEHSINFIYDYNTKTGDMLVKRFRSDDIFNVNLKKDEWNNITFDMKSLQRLMEVGEN